MHTVEELAKKERYDIECLKDIMAILRSENGCPWDKEQSHRSIRNDFIEETYEAIEAIDKDDMTLLREELGDVLLQVVFHSQIENEKGTFSFDDVVNDICAKLVHRHPHVFGDVVAETSGAVLANWKLIKGEEKKAERVTVTDNLRAVPASYPALMRAQKIGKRAGKAGFDFANAAETLEKVREEVDEVAAELKNSDANKARISEEIGDLLLAVTNVARFTGVDSEEALNKASDKFIGRFEKVERFALDKGAHIKDMSESELLSLWISAKETKR